MLPYLLDKAQLKQRAMQLEWKMVRFRVVLDSHPFHLLNLGTDSFKVSAWRTCFQRWSLAWIWYNSEWTIFKLTGTDIMSFIQHFSMVGSPGPNKSISHMNIHLICSCKKSLVLRLHHLGVVEKFSGMIFKPKSPFQKSEIFCDKVCFTGKFWFFFLWSGAGTKPAPSCLPSRFLAFTSANKTDRSFLIGLPRLRTESLHLSYVFCTILVVLLRANCNMPI